VLVLSVLHLLISPSTFYFNFKLIFFILIFMVLCLTQEKEKFVELNFAVDSISEVVPNNLRPPGDLCQLGANEPQVLLLYSQRCLFT